MKILVILHMCDDSDTQKTVTFLVSAFLSYSVAAVSYSCTGLLYLLHSQHHLHLPKLYRFEHCCDFYRKLCTGSHDSGCSVLWWLQLEGKSIAILAWMPKATVQATLGSTMYDHAVLALAASPLLASSDRVEHFRIQKLGLQVRKTSLGVADRTCAKFLYLQFLTTAVLCIVLTAPLGVLGIVLTQNRLLQRYFTP